MIPLKGWVFDMSVYAPFLERVDAELQRSVGKYGDWSDYSVDEMIAAVLGELHEVDVAIEAGDVAGDHGMVIEAIQAAGCLIKFAYQMEVRNGLRAACP